MHFTNRMSGRANRRYRSAALEAIGPRIEQGLHDLTSRTGLVDHRQVTDDNGQEAKAYFGCRSIARIGPIARGVSVLRALGTTALARMSMGPTHLRWLASS